MMTTPEGARASRYEHQQSGEAAMTIDLDAELRAVLAPMLDMLGDHTEGELAAVEDAVLASWERLLLAPLKAAYEKRGYDTGDYTVTAINDLLVAVRARAHPVGMGREEVV